MSRQPTEATQPGRLAHPGNGAEGPGLASLRWLARRMLAPDLAGLLERVPAPQLVSGGLTGPTRPMQDYVLRWIDRREPGSTFEARTRWIRWLPRRCFVRALLACGYDGLVYPQREAIVGHVFFQRRGSALHGFSTAVDEAFDGEGYSVVMVLDYVAYGAQLPGITELRIGTGRNNTTRRLLARIKKHERHLGWSVSPDGWVRFAPPAEGTR
jgi:hypothetical protein